MENENLTLAKHVIDLNAAPSIPSNHPHWKVKEHIKGGHYVWDSAKVELTLHPGQRTFALSGTKLSKAFAKMPVFNANLLDHLLKHQELISDEWSKNEKEESNRIIFWHTTYVDHNSNGLYVRLMVKIHSRWYEDYICINSGYSFGIKMPTLMKKAA